MVPLPKRNDDYSSAGLDANRVYAFFFTVASRSWALSHCAVNEADALPSSVQHIPLVSSRRRQETLKYSDCGQSLGLLWPWDPSTESRQSRQTFVSDP